MTVEYNEYGELTLGGTSLKTVAQSFGTPTIVYDEDQIRNQMRRYHQAFQQSGLKYNISYASKAFTCIQMVKLVQEEDLQHLKQVLNQVESTSMVTTKRNMKLDML